MNYYEKIGHDNLKKIIDVFVDRICDDLLIGYLFRKANRENLKQREFELIANFLGADIKYKGKNLKTIHQQHYIRAGQFNIRQKILRDTFQEFNIDNEIIEELIKHNEKLKRLIIKEKKSGV
jgi:truncated hemoglobin YjbI